MKRRTTRAMRPLTLGLALLTSACAAAPREGSPDSLTSTLIGLQQQQATGATGSVHGKHLFTGPDAITRFTDRPVSLIPLSPDLEKAISRARQQYLDGRRAPLPYPVALAHFAGLDRQVREIKRRGFSSLIRVTTTDPKEARFEFTDVPAGRWLLVATLTTRVSELYWAVPVEVRAGQALKQDLTEADIWLEAVIKNTTAEEVLLGRGRPLGQLTWILS